MFTKNNNLSKFTEGGREGGNSQSLLSKKENYSNVVKEGVVLTDLQNFFLFFSDGIPY